MEEEDDLFFVFSGTYFGARNKLYHKRYPKEKIININIRVIRTAAPKPSPGPI